MRNEGVPMRVGNARLVPTRARRNEPATLASCRGEPETLALRQCEPWTLAVSRRSPVRRQAPRSNVIFCQILRDSPFVRSSISFTDWSTTESPTCCMNSAATLEVTDNSSLQ